MQISATSRPIPTYKSVTGADHVFWNHLLFISEKKQFGSKRKNSDGALPLPANVGFNSKTEKKSTKSPANVLCVKML